MFHPDQPEQKKVGSSSYDASTQIDFDLSSLGSGSTVRLLTWDPYLNTYCIVPEHIVLLGEGATIRKCGCHVGEGRVLGLKQYLGTVGGMCQSNIHINARSQDFPAEQDARSYSLHLSVFGTHVYSKDAFFFSFFRIPENMEKYNCKLSKYHSITTSQVKVLMY